MLIKNTALDFQWQKKFPAVFLLLGSDPMQTEAVATALIEAWQRQYPGEVDKKVCYVMDSSDWAEVAGEANSYSLFATVSLLDIRFDKKTFDAATKKFLAAYLLKYRPFLKKKEQGKPCRLFYRLYPMQQPYKLGLPTN
jgi:DNA polymerase III delta subunit